MLLAGYVAISYVWSFEHISKKQTLPFSLFFDLFYICTSFCITDFNVLNLFCFLAPPLSYRARSLEEVPLSPFTRPSGHRSFSVLSSVVLMRLLWPIKQGYKDLLLVLLWDECHVVLLVCTGKFHKWLTQNCKKIRKLYEVKIRNKSIYLDRHNMFRLSTKRVLQLVCTTTQLLNDLLLGWNVQNVALIVSVGAGAVYKLHSITFLPTSHLLNFSRSDLRRTQWQLQSHDLRNNSTCAEVCCRLDPGSDSSKSPVLHKPNKSGRSTFSVPVTFMCPQFLRVKNMYSSIGSLPRPCVCQVSHKWQLKSFK